MVGCRMRLARACSGGVLLFGSVALPTAGHGAPAGGEVPAGYGTQAQAAASAQDGGPGGGGAQEDGDAAATPQSGDPGGAAQGGGYPAVAPGGAGPAGAAQGYEGPAATPGDADPDREAQGYGDPAAGGQADGSVPPQPLVYGYPASGYSGDGYPDGAAPGQPPGQAIVGPDGLTYVDGVPVGLIQDEAVALLFVGVLGGWGYYDRGRQWHEAPPEMRDRLERLHPGGRGLPPPGVARRRPDPPAAEARERPPAGGPGQDAIVGPARDVPGGPTVFRGEGDEAGRTRDRGVVPELRAGPGGGEPGRPGAAERFQGVLAGPGEGAGMERQVGRGFVTRGPGGQQPGNPVRPPPPRLAAPPARGPRQPRP